MIRGLSAIALLLSGCLSGDALHCPSGAVCPVDMVCVAGEAKCAAPERLEVCDGVDDAVECNYPGVSDGSCKDGLCIPAGCGNGVLEPEEMCDDGNIAPEDGCGNDCGAEGNDDCGRLVWGRKLRHGGTSVSAPFLVELAEQPDIGDGWRAGGGGFGIGEAALD